MARESNYEIQARQAKKRFLTWDMEALAEKFHLQRDETYLYLRFACCPYRISRKTGDVSRLADGVWVDGNRFEEVMTLLDLLCDSQPGRYLALRWKSMEAFGNHVHRTLLEEAADPAAVYFGEHVEEFRRACQALGGQKLPQGDAAYAFDLFDGLPMAVQLWLGDEEFPTQLRILWDENAKMYLKYETMYYAKDLMLGRIRENMHLG